MMYRLALTLLVPIVVSACAAGPYGPGPNSSPVVPGPSGEAPAGPLARSATYICEDLTTVVLTEGQSTAQATLNSGLLLSLARQPDPTGLRFGAPPYEFRARGGDATMLSNNRPFRCRVK